MIASCTHFKYWRWILSAGIDKFCVYDTTIVRDLVIVFAFKYNFDIIDKHLTPFAAADGPYDLTFLIQIDESTHKLKHRTKKIIKLIFFIIMYCTVNCQLGNDNIFDIHLKISVYRSLELCGIEFYKYISWLWHHNMQSWIVNIDTVLFSQPASQLKSRNVSLNFPLHTSGL